MSNMSEVRLKDCILTIIDYRGKTPAKLGGDWVNEGYRVISALNVHNGFIDNENDIRCVSEEIYNKWMQEKVQRNDCFLSSEGASLGENAIWDSDEQIVLGQRLFAIRTNPDILDPWFFAAYMQTKKFRQQIYQISTGSTVFGISQPLLLNIKFIIPNIKVQMKIGRLYKNIRSKIVQNNQIISNLEFLAKTIYDYWFLQFEFPNEEGKPYKSSGGKIVWNEELKREIPEGWEVGNLINNPLCSVIKNGIDYFDTKNYLPTANINGEIITDGDYITYENRESRANMQPTKLSVWFAKMKNSVKHLSIANNGDWFVNKYILSTGFEGLQCNKQTFGYIHSLINSSYFEAYKDTLAHGATQESVNDEDLKNIKFVVPNKKVLDKYASIVNPLLETKFSNFKQNQELASLRDFLLPMLMNGQVTFKEN